MRKCQALLLLGGFKVTMSSAAQPTDFHNGEANLVRAMSLLNEALSIMDALDVSAEVGARLQHVIDSLEALHGEQS